MNLPENYIVERRAVKHARLRVNEDESVNLFVPLDFTDVNIQDLLEKKASWIESKQRFFSQKTKILLS